MGGWQASVGYSDDVLVNHHLDDSSSFGAGSCSDNGNWYEVDRPFVIRTFGSFQGAELGFHCLSRWHLAGRQGKEWSALSPPRTTLKCQRNPRLLDAESHPDLPESATQKVTASSGPPSICQPLFSGSRGKEVLVGQFHSKRRFVFPKSGLQERCLYRVVIGTLSP